MNEVTTPPVDEPQVDAAAAEDDKRVPYDRFKQANDKAKQAADRVKELEAEIADRESAGLPELEQLKKRLEQAEKRADQAEGRATESEQAVARARAERLVLAAAKDFTDPDDAVLNIDLSAIEDSDQAERAVKRVAKAKPHLLKGEEKPLPGKVLSGGKAVTPGDPDRAALIDSQVQEAAGLAAELGKHLKT